MFSTNCRWQLTDPLAGYQLSSALFAEASTWIELQWVNHVTSPFWCLIWTILSDSTKPLFSGNILQCLPLNLHSSPFTTEGQQSLHCCWWNISLLPGDYSSEFVSRPPSCPIQINFVIVDRDSQQYKSLVKKSARKRKNKQMSSSRNFSAQRCCVMTTHEAGRQVNYWSVWLCGVGIN